MNNNSHLIPLGVLGKTYKLSGELHFLPYNHNSVLSLKDMDVLIGRDKKKINKIFVEGYSVQSNIIKFKDYSVGKSIVEENCETIVDDIFKTTKNI